MKRWQKKSIEPLNYEVFVCNKKKKEDLERKEIENRPSAVENKLDKTLRNLADLSDICRNYGMRDFVKYKEEPGSLDLIRHFTMGIPDSFATLKQNRDLNTAFMSCNLKKR